MTICGFALGVIVLAVTFGLIAIALVMGSGDKS